MTGKFAVHGGSLLQGCRTVKLNHKMDFRVLCFKEVSNNLCLGFTAVHQAMAVLRDAVAPMLGWLQRFRRPAPEDAAAIEVPRTRSCGASRAAVAISGVADIEESVWVRNNTRHCCGTDWHPFLIHRLIPSEEEAFRIFLFLFRPAQVALLEAMTCRALNNRHSRAHVCAV